MGTETLLDPFHQTNQSGYLLESFICVHSLLLGRKENVSKHTNTHNELSRN